MATFSILADKKIAQTIIQMSWNVALDVLALADDKSLYLHRLSGFQRAWGIVSDKPSCIGWRPDGNLLAVGIDRKLQLYSVETGELLQTLPDAAGQHGRASRWHQAPITSISWAENKKQTNTSPKFAERASRLPSLAAFPTEAHPSTLPGEAHTSGYHSIGGTQTKLNILVTVDAEGNIILSALGLLRIGHISLKSVLSDAATFSVVKSEFSAGLSELYVLVVYTTTAGSIKSSLLTFDASVLAACEATLFQRSVSGIFLEDTLNYLQHGISLTRTAWQDAHSQLKTRIAELLQAMRNESITTGVENEFIRMLLTGVASNPLSHWLQHTLKATGLKKVTRSVEGALEEMQTKLLPGHLYLAATSLLSRLSDLHTLTAASQHTLRLNELDTQVGLKEGLVKNYTNVATKLLLKIESLIQAIPTLKLRYTDFFQWLGRISAILGGDGAKLSRPTFREANLVDFIKNHLNQDVIGTIIGETDGRGQVASLSDLIADLREAHARTYEEIGADLSKNITLKSNFLLHHDAVVNLQMATDVNNRLTLSWQDDATLWILQRSTEEAAEEWKVTGVEAASEDSALLAQLLYGPESLCAISIDANDEVSVGTGPLDILQFHPVNPVEISESGGIVNYFDAVIMARPFSHQLADIQQQCSKLGAFPLTQVSLAPARAPRGGGLLALASETKRMLILDLETFEQMDETASQE